MKNFKIIAVILLFGMTVSCKGDKNATSNATSNANKSKEPQTACECFGKFNKEIDKFLNMSKKDANYMKAAKEVENFLLNDENCEKIMAAVDVEDRAEVEKKCPEYKEFEKKMELMNRMGGSEASSNEPQDNPTSNDAMVPEPDTYDEDLQELEDY